MSDFKHNHAKFIKNTKRMPQFVVKELDKVAEKTKAEVVPQMKVLVPVDEGLTRDSIGAFIAERDDGVILGIYAGDGTDKAPARLVEFYNNQPFFYPVIRNNSKRIKGRLKRAITKAAKSVYT